MKMALGASTGRVQMEVLRQTLWLAVAGVVIGSVASVLATRLIASMLFGTSAQDPMAYLGMAVAIAIVALVSGVSAGAANFADGSLWWRCRN